MKKQLIIIGLITLLICIGLSGCNEQTIEVSILEIKENGDKYINQTVTIIGVYNPVAIFDNNHTVGLCINIPDEINKPTLINGSEYRFTGIVKFGKTPHIYILIQDIYLDVTKIESI
jgi:hypothetical protein